jgi:hypothetical protein
MIFYGFSIKRLNIEFWSNIFDSIISVEFVSKWYERLSAGIGFYQRVKINFDCVYVTNWVGKPAEVVSFGRRRYPEEQKLRFRRRFIQNAYSIQINSFDRREYQVIQSVRPACPVHLILRATAPEVSLPIRLVDMIVALTATE